MSASGQPADAPASGQASELERLTRELAQVRAEFQDFVHSVSHDLRAPLRHINAFAKIIEEDLDHPPPDILGHLATIRQSAQLLMQQLEGLTQLSRLALQACKPGRVDAGALVRDAIQEVMLLYPQRAIEWQVAADLPPLVADANLLRQVFVHLLDNACKFSRHRTPAAITVSWQSLGEGQCRVSVQDNGVGFNPKQADQLFKVFAKLHPVREFAGLGLGLVQCQKLLAHMGGSVSVTGALDAGCRVSVTLPGTPL